MQIRKRLSSLLLKMVTGRELHLKNIALLTEEELALLTSNAASEMVLLLQSHLLQKKMTLSLFQNQALLLECLLKQFLLLEEIHKECDLCVLKMAIVLLRAQRSREKKVLLKYK